MVDDLISSFVVMWAVIDPIGTIPVYLAVTKEYDDGERKNIARYAAVVAFFILLFFLILGEVLLRAMGVPLPAFQVAGGLVLMLFALDMIFGNSKPENELQFVKNTRETAIFPLAVPSIAGPGAMLAIVLMTDNSSHSLTSQISTAAIMAIVLVFTYIAMLMAGRINKVIGNGGAIIISKIMGMILASMAATNILIGIRDFFKLGV